MKGVPIRIEIGPRDLETNECVIVKRVNNEKIKVKIDELATIVPELFKQIHEEMYQRALLNVTENTRVAKTYDEFKSLIQTKPGYIKMMWCGHQECEVKIKEETQATSRCIPFEQEHITENCPVCGRKAEKLVYFAKAY
jgi:prolyl-tRNA synthetase